MTHYNQYKVTDLKRIFELVRAYPFAAICRNNVASDMPDVVSTPAIINSTEDGLEFHMARANPAYDNFKEGGKTHIIFRGPNAHISPAWYAARFQNGDRSRTAPTWDYVEARFQTVISPMDHSELIHHLGRLVTQFEASVKNGWAFSEIDPEKLREWSGMIAGFHVKIENAEAILKLSQEQTAEDREHIVKGLSRRGEGFDDFVAGLIADLNHG